jgi:hypothetical protein
MVAPALQRAASKIRSFCFLCLFGDIVKGSISLQNVDKENAIYGF